MTVRSVMENVLNLSIEKLFFLFFAGSILVCLQFLAFHQDGNCERCRIYYPTTSVPVLHFQWNGGKGV